MSADYRIYEKALTASYGEAAERYRRDDEVEIRTKNHRRVCGNLARISSSFGRSIHVLDVGCGTGRHFHCLRNVELLVGVDISAEMLRAAETPVKSDELSAKNIRLLQRNIYEHSFSSGMFDLIYSLDVFGHGAQFTIELCRKFYDWLDEAGRLYLNAVETSEDPPLIVGRRKLKRALYPLLPRRVKQKLDEREARLPLFTMTDAELETVMRAGGFTDFSISANFCESPMCNGGHLECIATKRQRRVSIAQARGNQMRMPS